MREVSGACHCDTLRLLAGAVCIRNALIWCRKRVNSSVLSISFLPITWAFKCTCRLRCLNLTCTELIFWAAYQLYSKSWGAEDRQAGSAFNVSSWYNLKRHVLSANYGNSNMETLSSLGRKGLGFLYFLKLRALNIQYQCKPALLLFDHATLTKAILSKKTEKTF